MELTLPEIKARLAAKYDEDTLLQMLGINAEKLLDLAEDIVEDMREELLADLEADQKEFDGNN